MGTLVHIVEMFCNDLRALELFVQCAPCFESVVKISLRKFIECSQLNIRGTDTCFQCLEGAVASRTFGKAR